MSQPDIMKSKRKGWRIAQVLQATGGEFCRFKKGERVKAWGDSRWYCTVERLVWRGTMMPLAHRCFNIPKRFLKFEVEKDAYCEVPILETSRPSTMRTFRPCGKRAVAVTRGECRCEFHFGYK